MREITGSAYCTKHTVKHSLRFSYCVTYILYAGGEHDKLVHSGGKFEEFANAGAYLHISAVTLLDGTYFRHLSGSELTRGALFLAA